jgi:2',3'-cyclic-nucleotide 2'-phosphodiesterase (5'-nucleotidase family)
VARWAAFINRQKNPDAAWLTVDAGDYVDRVGTGGCSSKCQFMVVSYRDLHYDVLNIGKQEVWMGYETLKAMMDTVKGTEFVSANLINIHTKKPLAKPTVIKDYGKFRVGVIGLLAENDFPKGSSLLDSANLSVMPYMDAAKKYLPGLISKTDAVVVLAELGSGAIDTLVKEFPDIALIISTGALRSGESPTTIGKTRVVGTGSSGYTGHYAMLDFNPGKADSIGFTAFQDQLTATYEEKGVWEDRLTAFSAQPASAPAVKSTAPGTVTNSGTPIKVDTKATAPTSPKVDTKANKG